jgi:hypothetical protein
MSNHDVEPSIPVNPDLMMKVTDVFSYNGGLETVMSEFGDEFEEVIRAIEGNRAEQVYVKKSSEKRLEHMLLASPGVMNHNILIEALHDEQGWAVDHASGRNWRDLEKIGKKPRSISDDECALDIKPSERWGKRSVDAMKNGVAVEAQFGKYAFMVYDVLGKFGHFKRAGRINLGIELLPSNEMVHQMSTGIGYYEQLKTELEHLPRDYVAQEYRVPVLAIGVGFKGDSIGIDNLPEEAKQYEQSVVEGY